MSVWWIHIRVQECCQSLNVGPMEIPAKEVLQDNDQTIFNSNRNNVSVSSSLKDIQINLDNISPV